MSKKVIIVGGVAGGASTAARLRRLDETVEIIMFEKGEYISFANCGLPYYIGEVIDEREKLIVQTVEQMSTKFKIDIRNLKSTKKIKLLPLQIIKQVKVTKKLTMYSFYHLGLSLSNQGFLESTNAIIYLP